MKTKFFRATPGWGTSDIDSVINSWLNVNNIMENLEKLNKFISVLKNYDCDDFIINEIKSHYKGEDESEDFQSFGDFEVKIIDKFEDLEVLKGFSFYYHDHDCDSGITFILCKNGKIAYFEEDYFISDVIIENPNIFYHLYEEDEPESELEKKEDSTEYLRRYANAYFVIICKNIAPIIMKIDHDYNDLKYKKSGSNIVIININDETNNRRTIINFDELKNIDVKTLEECEKIRKEQSIKLVKKCIDERIVIYHLRAKDHGITMPLFLEKENNQYIIKCPDSAKKHLIGEKGYNIKKICNELGLNYIKIV